MGSVLGRTTNKTVFDEYGYFEVMNTGKRLFLKPSAGLNNTSHHKSTTVLK
jgi:hypothetical protein